MKKTLAKILIFSLIITSVFAIASPVFAQDKPTGSAVQSNVNNQGNSVLAKIFGSESLQDMFNSLVAMIGVFAMSTTATFLGFCAYIFDVAMRLTLNIKDFVNATPAVFSTWRILRDITGMAFIFYLLYAAIQMITGWGEGNYGKTIKNIVIAGVLVNFSFFITSVGIDASNIVSQAIYNAILPTHNVVKIDKDNNLTSIVASDSKANISNIFMNSLRIQKIYDSNGNKLGTNLGNPVKIALISLAGVVMMFTTGISFLLASIAVMARTVVLIFLLAFSSMHWAGMVLPDVKKHFSFFTTQLKAQLIFLPTYLLLMYVGLSILNGSEFFDTGNTLNDASMTGTNWLLPFIIIGVNFAIVIVVLNLPLFVALSMGGWSTQIISKYKGKFDALSIWKTIGNRTWNSTGATAWQNTGGRAASKLANLEGVKNFAAKNALGQFALNNLRGAAKSYNEKLDKQVKERTDFANSLGFDERAILNMKRVANDKIKNALDQEARARSMGNTAAADRYKNYADQLKTELSTNIANKQKERQADYAKRLEKRSSNPETLFTKIARKNKAAAAKINIDVWQKQLDKKKEALGELKKKLETVQNDIRRDKARNPGGLASQVNLDAELDIKAKIAAATRGPAGSTDITQMGTDDLQDMIDNAKLIR